MMKYPSIPIELSESIFILLRDLIHERTGVIYDTSKCDILADKLSARLIELSLDSFLDYYYLLKYDAGAEEEWKYVMDALAVLETFFWREFDQVQALVDVLVPQYFQNQTTAKVPLQIWCAACATGEEPLTIAMALNERGWFERAPIEIYATDGSRSAIAKAQSGLYRERSFRTLSPILKEKYFSQEGGLWRISPDIHARVHWATVNLLDARQVKHFAIAPMIFCRNVFIYFSNKAISQTLSIFFECMPSPGYLFVGVSESLLKLTNDFELEEIDNAFVYVKR